MKRFLETAKGLALSIVLLTIAIVLLKYLFIPAMAVTLVVVFWKKKFYQGINRLSRILYTAALSIDQFANVAFQEFWNLTLRKNTGYKFGNPDETISGVLGKNKRDGTLSGIGKALDYILDKLDPGHSINSIEDDEESETQDS